MWPQTLQMTRDECRGILRRLELESYSNVISVFRAQGGLSEPKLKLLEELRSIFHISQERHRAEARRVANDEQLCTIAEAISGPNTWQEWSREGRRAYPLLPRVDPQTALTIIANDIAAKVRAENEQLLLPAETSSIEEVSQSVTRTQHELHLVYDEPFKMPDIPAEARKNLKRNNPDSTTATTVTKKRNTHHHQQDAALKHITANDAEASPKVTSKGKVNDKALQQRFFHNQYQKHKQKMGSKKAASASNQNALQMQQLSSTTTKRSNAITKSGRRAQKLLQRQLQQHQRQLQQTRQKLHIQQQQPLLPATQQELGAIPAHNNNINSYVDYATMEHQSVEIMEENDLSPVSAKQYHKNMEMETSPTSTIKSQKKTTVQGYIADDKQLLAFNPRQLVTQLPLPAVSGTKLRSSILSSGPKAIPKKTAAEVETAIDSVNVEGTTVNNMSKPSMATFATTPSKSLSMRVLPYDNQYPPVQQRQSISQTSIGVFTSESSLKNNQTASTNHNNSSPTSTSTNLKEKNLLSTATTTPVQKYIVEERQNAPTTGVTTTASANIIKTLPASSLNNTLITPLTPPASVVLAAQATSNVNSQAVFRKTPQTNLIKTVNMTLPAGSSPPASTICAACPGNASIGGSTGSPQIISNIKLAPALSTGTAQFNLKHMASCGNTLRASVKICQSPNGKVFLQPANLSEATKAKLQTSFVQKLSASMTPSATSTVKPSSPTMGGQQQQRIAIQKVQIISGPNMLANTTAAGNTATNAPKSTSLSIGGNKSNMIFLPASAASNMRPITLATKSVMGTALGGLVSAAASAKPIQALTDAKSPPNLVVIGPTTPLANTIAGQTSTLTVLAKQQTVVSAPTTVSSTFITEDTPVDIINMPFIVPDGRSTGEDLKKDDEKSVNVNDKQSHSVSPQSQQSLLVLGATDWEMELDQATKITMTTPTSNQLKAGSTNQNMDFSNDIIIDECFEDVIEEEVVDEAAVTQDDEQEHRQQNNQSFSPHAIGAAVATTRGDAVMVADIPGAGKSHVGQMVEIDENPGVEYIDMDLENHQFTVQNTKEGNLRVSFKSAVADATQICEANKKFATNLVAAYVPTAVEAPPLATISSLIQSNISH